MTNEQLLATVHKNGGDKGLDEVLTKYHACLDTYEWMLISLHGMPERDERLQSIVEYWFEQNPTEEQEDIWRKEREDDRRHQARLATEIRGA